MRSAASIAENTLTMSIILLTLMMLAAAPALAQEPIGAEGQAPIRTALRFLASSSAAARSVPS
jgi:hypothetical protein